MLSAACSIVELWLISLGTHCQNNLFCYSTITCGIIAWIQFFVRNAFLSNRIWGEYLFRYHWRKSNVGLELWDWKFGQKLLSARELLAFFGLFSKKECLLRLSHLYVFFSPIPSACPDVPSAPSAIVLLLCTGSEMVLGWRAPFSDGGSPVRGYYLDQKEKGMEIWREVNVKPVKERQFKVGNTESFGPFLWNLSADLGDGLVTVTDTGTVLGFQWNVCCQPDWHRKQSTLCNAVFKETIFLHLKW